MKLLIDTDAFCKLGIAGLLANAAGLFGVTLSDYGRLAAVPYMLRKGRLFRRYGPETCSALLAQAREMPVCPELVSASLEPFASDPNIDPGEVQLFAATAQFDLITISGDKRAIRSIISRWSYRSSIHWPSLESGSDGVGNLLEAEALANAVPDNTARLVAHATRSFPLLQNLDRVFGPQHLDEEVWVAVLIPLRPPYGSKLNSVLRHLGVQ